jgi:acyl-CoA dehydrogenase
MLLPTLPAPLPVEWLKKLGIHDILGVVKVEEWDYIHTMIYADEVLAPPLPSSQKLQDS